MLRTDGDESEDSLKNIEETIKGFVLAVRKLFEDCINVWIIQLKRIHNHYCNLNYYFLEHLTWGFAQMGSSVRKKKFSFPVGVVIHHFKISLSLTVPGG